MANITNSFLALKKKYPNMSDSEAMKKAQNMAAKTITKIRKADAKKRKGKKVGWVEKLKMGVTKELQSKRHSPAGQMERRHKKAGRK